MTYRLRNLLCLSAATSLTFAVGCGGSVFSTDEDDSTGGTSSGGSAHTGGSPSGGASSGGTSTGGAASGGTSTGGASTGGASTGGASTGGATGTCSVDDDCVAVLDASAPCFSPGCSAPTAASREDVAQNRCLMLWEARNEAPPEGCAPDDVVVCPALCVAPPTCVTPICDGGQCQVKLGYSDEECSQTTDCDTASKELQAAFDAARACNPDLDNIQCNGKETIADTCGCPFIVNETHPELVQAARDALTTYNAVCPPSPCPLVLCAEPTSGSCGSNGVCTAN